MAYTSNGRSSSGGGLHPAYEQYGQKAATAILSRVSTVPFKHQDKVFRKIVNTIDPSLYGRTKEIANRYRAQGQSPQQALHNGLARAMSTGILAEVVKLGQTGGKPKLRTQTGLGCYGCAAAMGDTPLLIPAQVSSNPAAMTSSTPIAGTCTPDGQYIYYVADPTTGTLALRRKTATDVCSGTSGTNPTQTVHTSGSRPPVSDTFPPVATDDPGAGPWMQVGSFKIPANASKFTIHWTGPLPTDWAQAIASSISNNPDQDSTSGHPYGRLADFLGSSMPSRVNSSYFVKPSIKAIAGSTVVTLPSSPGDGPADIPIPAGAKNGGVSIDYADFTPVVSTQHPTTGEDWGVYMRLAAADPTKKWDSTTNPYVLHLEWRKIDRHWYDQVWDFIKHLPAMIIDAIVDAVNAVGGLACELLSGTAGQAGAVVGGAAIGVAAGGAKGATAGAQAGAAGAAIASKECSQPVAPPTVTSSSWFLPLMLIGGGAAVIAVLNKRKKPQP